METAELITILTLIYYLGIFTIIILGIIFIIKFIKRCSNFIKTTEQRLDKSCDELKEIKETIKNIEIILKEIDFRSDNKN